MNLTASDLQAIRQIVREEISGVENDVKIIYKMLDNLQKAFRALAKALEPTNL